MSISTKANSLMKSSSPIGSGKPVICRVKSYKIEAELIWGSKIRRGIALAGLLDSITLSQYLI